MKKELEKAVIVNAQRAADKTMTAYQAVEFSLAALNAIQALEKLQMLTKISKISVHK